MTQMSTSLYKTLADYYNSARLAMVGASEYLNLATNAVVDITTSNYPDTSPNASAALSVELNLLASLNSAYIGVNSLTNSTSSLLVGVRAINDYVVRNDATGATDPLTDFVNSVAWTDGCVPIYWTELSAAAGYDTTDWNVCSVS